MIGLSLGVCIAAGILTPVRLPLQSGISPSDQKNDSALVVEARQLPDTTRKALSMALSSAVSAGTQRERDASLLRARRLADAYARAWKDSFFVRQVGRFMGFSRVEQKSRVLADSLRLAGNAALTRDGVPAAMTLWRESLRLAIALRDTAALAPAELAVGAGFYRMGQGDSAGTYVTVARKLAEQSGDLRTTGNAIGLLASLRKDRGDLAGAAELYRRASIIRARSGDSRGVAADQNNLGLIAQEMGDISGATRAFERALSINRHYGRQSLIALNLSNLAGVVATSKDYPRADSLYREALRINRASGDTAETGFVLQALGRLQISRGNYADARAMLTEALMIHEKSGAIMDAIAVRTDLASLQGASGDPEGAIRTLSQNERVAVSAKAPPEVEAGLALARGDLALQFGTFADASSDYARAEQLYAAGGNAAGRAQARQGRALLLHLRDDDEASLRLLNEVASAQTTTGDLRSAALTGLLTADVQRARGDLGGARRTLGRSLRTLHKAGDAVGEAAALTVLGDLAQSDHSARVAENYYRQGLDRLGDRPAADVRWRLHAGLAEALNSRGVLNDAAREFRVAIDLAEHTAAGFQLGDRKSGFLSDKWSVYSELALLEQRRGRADEAFAVSERIRARQMLDLLARGRVSIPRLVSSTTSSWREVASHLKSHEALLEYLVTDSASTVFVVTSDTVAAIDLRATHQTLADRVEFARRAMAMPSGAESVPRWRAPLERLYADLIQPVEQRGFLRGKRTLIVVPHAELHFLSFASLISPDAPNRYLIEKFQVDYAPSAMAWVALGQRNRSSSNRNVLAFAPHVDRLPASANEVQAIARIYGARATVRTGAAASKEAFRSAVRTAGTLHLATFGVLNSHNPLYSFVELAPGEKDNGRLEVNEVFRLGLSGQLVVLSACQTALSSGGIADVPPGDDWVGMVQGFLQGGASNVVASLWPVDDRATARLMEQFHQRLAAGVPVGDALAGAQRALIKGKTFNPSDWAAFVVNGGFAQP